MTPPFSQSSSFSFTYTLHQSTIGSILKQRPTQFTSHSQTYFSLRKKITHTHTKKKYLVTDATETAFIHPKRPNQSVYKKPAQMIA